MFIRWCFWLMVATLTTSGILPSAKHLFERAQVAYMLGYSDLELRYLQQSAECGYPPAQFYLAQRLPAQAKHYYRLAAQTLPEAYTPLADCYAEEGDWEAALMWCQRAADAGDRRAQHRLGCWLSEGRNGIRDLAAAHEWFRRAAERNEPDAQWAMGEASLGRGGFSRNPQAAFKWFSYAAERGHVLAQQRLAQCYQEGIGIAPNHALATYWRKRAKQEK